MNNQNDIKILIFKQWNSDSDAADRCRINMQNQNFFLVFLREKNSEYIQNILNIYI